ncbi:TetR/AcrR family transcriptional regulator [Mycolicibacterium stellerae]|uniref:TetR/AcrR family transcriptional regulator n=1 Tax=Mycolicibacterium stellerae TaxID=2358193 RepID=UPI000F0BC2EF|nr:TetR/AcrR family transcriptional regulator [Mycolicibacterium stellerae]
MGRPSVKEQLVDRTRGVWLERGFEGASVHDLVTAAGVPKGSFYNHFPSKEHFAVEHVHRYVRTLQLEALRDAPGSAVDAVREHFEHQIAARQEGRMDAGCLLGTFSNSVTDSYPALRAAVRHGFEQWIEALTAVLSRACAAGEIPATSEPADLAAALVDGFEGAIARTRATGLADPLRVFVTVTLAEFTRRP